MTLLMSVRRLRASLFCTLLSYLLLASSLTPFAPRAAATVTALPAPAVAAAAAQAAPAREGELLVRFREGMTEGAKGAALSTRGARLKARLRGRSRLERVEARAGTE